MTIVSALPSVPSRGNPATFNTLFEAFLTALQGTFVSQVNTVAGEINTAASAAATSASTATTQASAASSSASSAASSAITAAASIAAGAAFRGNWSALTGALTVPASVSHGGLLWILTSNIADVTAKTPGVASEWMRVDAGIKQVVVASTSTAFSTTSTSFVTTNLSASITPKSTASKVLAIAVTQSLANLTNASGAWVEIFRDSTAVGPIEVVYSTVGVRVFTAVLDSPASVSALTYSLRAKTENASYAASLARNLSYDYLILMEVLP